MDPIDRSLLAELGEMLGPRLDTVIETFITNLTGQLADIRAPLTSGDHVAVRAAAHRLKGAAGSVGALALADAAARLEAAATAEDLAAMQTSAAPLDAIAREAVVALRER